MRVGNCVKHVQKKIDSRFDAESPVIAVLVNRLAFYIFEDEIRLAFRGYSSVDQFGNMRMRESAENAAFALEPVGADLANHRQVYELYCRLALEASIAALR